MQALHRLIIFIVVTVYICGIGANPIAGIFDPSCFVSQGNCPNENVTFWLYTKSNRDKPIPLDPLNLNPWNFQPPRQVKILLHGYTGDRDFSPNSWIRPALLDHTDAYVISIDYGPLVRAPCYVLAVRNLPLVSRCLAQLINNLLDLNIVQSEQLHIIGFSLGGQVAGQTANYVKRKLKRITGLDPAKPLFILGSDTNRLDAGDAEFVDVIHTDTMGRGMLRAMGHVDFYPNFGLTQPGCPEENPDDPGSCNHDRAPQFYAESIASKNGFWGRKCSSWLFYIFGLCPTSGTEEIMGFHVTNISSGSIFLKTSPKSPFAMGNSIPKDNSKFLNKFHLRSFAMEMDNEFEPQLEDGFLEYDRAKEMNSYNSFKWRKEKLSPRIDFVPLGI